MTLAQLKKQIENRLDAVKTYVDRDVPDVIGAEAKAEFERNFEKESFDGKKWQDVKRRDPNSPWYGHSGQTGKKSNSRKSAKILSGETGELKEATTWRKEGNSVIISNDKPYAKVHNEGGTAKIYGKKPFTMPRRQFIGATPKLIDNIIDKINRDLTKITTS